MVDYFFNNPDLRSTLLDRIRGMGDTERIISKAAVGRITPREIVQLKNSLNLLADVKKACDESGEPTLLRIGSS